MLCGLVIIIKNLNSINSRRPWPPILISHLFQHSLFLDSWPQVSSGLLTYDCSKSDGILPQTAVKSCSHNIMFNPLGKETTDVYSLTMHNVQASDEGWYCCIATNEGGTGVQ